MAVETSPEPRQIEHSASQFDSQTTDLIEQRFVAPLEDSQETCVSSNRHSDNDLELDPLAPPENSQQTQGVTSTWRNRNCSHGVNVGNQSLQSTKGPFISRPLPEDPVDFQNGFQYSRAPIPHFQVAPLNTPRKGLALESNSKNDRFVKPEYPSCGPDSHPSDDLPIDSRDVSGTGAKVDESAPKTRTKTYDVVVIPSDPLSDKTVDTHKQPHTSPMRDPVTGLPSRNTSPLNKVLAPFQQPKLHVRSPTTKLKTPRLPKAFEEIRRKALIQSNRTDSPSQAVHHSHSRGVKASSGFNTPELHQNLARTHVVSRIPTRRVQEQPAGCPNSYGSPHTPETKRPSRKPPKSRPSAEELTSPFTQGGHKEYSVFTRPVSEASNISRIRTPLRKEQIRIQKRPAKLGMKESNARRHRLIRSWNDFFIYEADRNEHWEAKMDEMVEQLAERNNRAAEYLEKIRKQEQVITDLKIQKQEHYAIHQEQVVSLANSEERRQKLRERMKEYKDRLNDATIEQQKIGQMKQAELKHQEDNIQESVKQVGALSREEIQKLSLKIKALEAELAERQKDIDREKDHNNNLCRELENLHELNKSSLVSLNTQNQELMSKSDERNVQIQNVEQSVMQQERRILLEFREYAASDREQSLKAIEGLRTDILGIRDFCASLSEKVQASQNTSEWQEKVMCVQVEHRALLRETGRLEEELAKMHDGAKKQHQQHGNLQRELDSLKAKAEAADASNSIIESLEKEKKEIQECLDEKETCIHNLEDELRAVNEALSAQDCRLKDQEHQLQDQREKHKETIATYHEQQDQAAEQAREECMRIRVEYHKIENRLHDTEQDYSRLQKEMTQVKQRAESDLRNSIDEAAKQAQEILEPMADLMDKISEKLQASEQAKGNLDAKLEAWSKGQAETSLLRQATQKLAKTQKKSTESGKLLEDLLDVQKKLDSTWEWHKSEFDALNRAHNLEHSAKANMDITSRLGHKGEQQSEILHVANRHVMIQSPAIGDDDEKMAPISIEEERVTRRQAASLKGIMKSPAFQNDRRLEGQHNETVLTTNKQTGESSKGKLERSDAKPILVSHSAYNRPVLGSSARLEGPVNDSTPESTETTFTKTVVSKKRKRAETKTDQRANAVEKMPRPAARRRAKVSDSMSNGLHSPNGPEPATNAAHIQAQLWHPRGGPIEQKPRPFATYGSMSLEQLRLGNA
ncbi:hypothetical protein F5Y09DRAFT_357518 [Xylaria sp. FL1042]|nr:hypothetical protein F5Y09DRAFT_357518 [Xylaria sp. FL1042]